MLGIYVAYSMGCGISGASPHPIESQYFAKVEGTDKTRFEREHYDNMTLRQARCDACRRMVNFSWAGWGPLLLVSRRIISRSGGKWKIVPPDTIHHIGTSSDDGVRLFSMGS